MCVIKEVAVKFGRQVIKQAPKYGAKILLGIPAEVGIYFASQKIIKEVENIKKQRVIVDVVEA